MKLVSCHIENFGKFQNFDYDFAEGKNVIHEKNAWGKSTLAAFIKVMFYGFSGEGKRSETENERKRFSPWQSGVYGGNIVFEVSGKVYRLERIFGPKKSGTDTFGLYDHRTNLPSDDYSENIGEELFEINSESFMKTVFIAQQDCETDVTPDINAKIGNISDQTADMGRYDDVQKKLGDMINKLSPNRVTGELHKLSSRIFELREDIRNKDGLLENLDNIDTEIGKLKAQKETCHEKQGRIQEQLSKLAEVKDAKARVLQYKNVLKDEEDARKKFEETRSFFPGDVPNLSEIDEEIKLVDEIENSSQAAKNFSFSDEDADKFSKVSGMFKGNAPTAEELSNIESEIDDYFDLKDEQAKAALTESEEKRFQECTDLFSMYRPDKRVIERMAGEWAERRNRKDTLATKKANAQLLSSMAIDKKEKSPYKILGFALVALALILMAMGASVIFLYNLILGIILVAGGVILVVPGILLVLKKEDKKTLDEKKAAMENYEKLQSEIESDENYIDQVDTEVRVLWGRLGLEFNEMDVYEKLSDIRNMVREYDDLVEKYDAYKKAHYEEKLFDKGRQIAAFFDKFGVETSEKEFLRSYHKLKTDAADFERLKRQSSESKKAKEAEGETSKEVSSYIRSLGLEVAGGGADLDAPADELKSVLMKIRDKVVALSGQREVLEEKENARKRYEEAEDVEYLKSIGLSDDAENEASMEMLTGEFNALKKEIDEITMNEDGFIRQKEYLLEKLETIENAEEEMIELSERQEALQRKYEVICKTTEYLEKAKVNFSAKYMDVIKASFQKYHDIISDSEEKYELDANLKVSLKSKGALRDIELMSEGYKDLVGLCRRMAMIDSMYKKEKPFLILDDPFVNLDEDRLKGALSFLDIIAGDYQTIYFVCHDSRA